MNPFKRHTIVAQLVTPRVRAAVFVTVEWDGRRLSLTGVEGPKSNGDAVGSCGQVTLGCADHVNRIPEYDRLAEVWDRWHLNDMRAGCEHQRAAGWNVAEGLEIVTYKLTAEAWEIRRSSERAAIRAAIEGRAAMLSDVARAVLAFDIGRDTNSPPDADSPLSGMLEVAERVTKRAGWVYEREHPGGLLGKPCPTCGFKYGSAWLYEAVPEDVLTFLRSLPDDGDRLPARWRA